MALDPSIIFMGKTPDFQKSLGESIDFGQGLRKLVVGRKIGQMNQLATPEEKQAFIQKNNLFGRELFQTLKDQEVAAAKAANDQLKFNVDLAKTQAETEKLGFESKKVGAETGTITIDNSVKLLENANRALKVAAQTGDANAATLALNNAHKAGTITPELYEQYSQQITSMSTKPELLKQFVQGIVLSGEKDAMKYIQADQNTVLNNKTSRENNQNSVNAQIYSINQTAATADKNRAVQMQRLEFDQQQAYFQKNKPVGFGVDVNGRKYAILPNGNSVYIKDENGNYVIEQVKSGNGGGLTEQQSKDALFGARMQEANKILSALEAKDIKAPVMNSLPFGDKFSNALPSILGGASAEQQQYVQAQRDFINAVLRKESGAVIADSEFENAQKQYFPQIGDSKDVIAQKSKNRELAMRMIVNGSGVQGKTLINGATNSQNQLQPGQVPSAGAGGSALSFYK